MSVQTMPGSNRPGWLTFAAVVMFAVGAMDLLSSIYYFNNSARINAVSGGGFGHHTWVWGLTDLVLSLVSLYGGYSLLGGHTFGRVVGYLWAGLVIVDSFLILGYAPLFGFALLLLATLVIYALTTTSRWIEPA
jgi:hypothetical protein